MKVPTCADMAALDGRSRTEFGVPAMILMENASRSAAEIILRETRFGRTGEGSAVVAVGKGNNGGDALVAARHRWASGRRNIRVLLLQAGLGELPRMQFEILRRWGIPSLLWEESPGEAAALLDKASLVVDGLYGIGLRGSLEGASAGLVERINASPGEVVCLDLPSGLGSGYRMGMPAVRADLTITFELPKLCLYLPAGRLLAGRIVVAPAGFPPAAVAEVPAEASLVGEADLAGLLPAPSPGDYKNTRGHVAVFAGARGTTGAASLAAEAALRSGAGLVSLFTDPDLLPVLAAGAGGVMVKPLPEGPEDRDGGRFSAFLAGPGWGVTGERLSRLEALLRSGLPGVLDADGLTLLNLLRRTARPDLRGRILTPHPGEFAALSGRSREEVLSDPLPIMDGICRELGCVLALKGHVTIVREPDGRTRIFDGMNPALGTGGSGDVLAGLMAGLLGRGLPPGDAAAAAVILHGRAGRMAREEGGFFAAQDLMPHISREAWKDAPGK